MIVVDTNVLSEQMKQFLPRLFMRGFKVKIRHIFLRLRYVKLRFSWESLYYRTVNASVILNLRRSKSSLYSLAGSKRSTPMPLPPMPTLSRHAGDWGDQLTTSMRRLLPSRGRADFAWQREIPRILRASDC